MIDLDPEAVAAAGQFRPGRPAPGVNHVDATTRNPTLSLRLSGLFLLRFAARQLSASLFHEPPRRTRGVSSRPTGGGWRGARGGIKDGRGREEADRTFTGRLAALQPFN